MNIFQKLLSKILPVSAFSKPKYNVKYTKIAFDASVMDNKDLGIGMYDITNKVRLCEGGVISKQCSLTGETEAFKFTLEYADKQGFKNLALFTDNQILARQDINKYLKGYNFERVTLTWIPRELNAEADKLSKEGQKINLDGLDFSDLEPANTTQKAKPVKVSLKETFAKYSHTQKVQFISKLAVTDSEKEFGRFLIQGTPENYKFQPGNKMAPLMRMAITILEPSDMNSYLRRRFKKFKMDNGHIMSTLSYSKFEKEFDKRKVKALEELKNKKEIKPLYKDSLVKNNKKAA